MTPDLWTSAAERASEVATGERLKRGGQQQATSAIPYDTRCTVKAITEVIVRSGQPFAWTEIKPDTAQWDDEQPASPIRCVRSELPPMVRDVLDLHPCYWGALSTEWQGNGLIVSCGRAKRASKVSRKYVTLWIKAPTLKPATMGVGI